MKKFTLLFLMLAFTFWAKSQIITPSTKPNKCQQLMIERGYGMFIHFGVNTFANVEWSDGTVPAGKYNPAKLDCDQWVRIARDAGFRYVLLTTKHHDGFCLWDSKFTDYDVASSPVKTDVVAEVAKACKKYGVKFAVYYSLWDRHEPSYKDPDPQKYIDYMKNQLTELLNNYGEVVELWFDGGWARKPQDWGIDQVYTLVKKLQPNCAVGINHTIVSQEGTRKLLPTDSMTVDNKYSFHYFPGDFRLWDPELACKNDKKQYLHEGKSYYLPFEHTICISKQWTWFQKATPVPVRDLDELEELFYWCTDNHNTLVLDIPPDNTGLIREHEANAAISLAKRIGIQPGKPLPKNGKNISFGKNASASNVYNNETTKYGAWAAVDGAMKSRWACSDTLAELVIDLNPADKFNKISIFEYQDRKSRSDKSDFFSNYRFNRIQAYTIDILKDNEWLTIYRGDEPMGDCKVIRFPNSYRTSKIRLKVLKASAPPSIWEFNVIDFKNNE
jgi:alpha-L-fucosidase